MRFFITVLSLLSSATTLSADKVPQFERDVEPLMKQYCSQCHGEALQMGELDLRAPSLMLKGGIHGPSVQKGSAEESLLYQRIADDQMPMGAKKLTADEKRVIKEWIDAGMPATSSIEIEQTAKSSADHWAFSTPQPPAVPSVRNAAWIRTPVDAFILQKLEEKGIQHVVPDLLPSDHYADASHPLTQGYTLLAKRLLENDVFQRWLERSALDH